MKPICSWPPTFSFTATICCRGGLPCWSCTLMAAMVSSMPRPSRPRALLPSAMVAVCGSPARSAAETVMVCPSSP